MSSSTNYNSNRYGTPYMGKSLNGDEIPLKREYFLLVKNGKKTVEGRIKTGPFKNARQDDVITFKNGEDRVRCRITDVVSYNSFKEMLEREGLENCLPGVRSLEEGVRIYNNIPGYADKAFRFGVIALRILREPDTNSSANPVMPKVRSLLEIPIVSSNSRPQERQYRESNDFHDRRDGVSSSDRYRQSERKEPDHDRLRRDSYDKPKDRSDDRISSRSSRDKEDYPRDKYNRDNHYSNEKHSNASSERPRERSDDRITSGSSTRDKEELSRDRHDGDKQRSVELREEASSRKRKFDDVKDSISQAEKDKEEYSNKKMRTNDEGAKK